MGNSAETCFIEMTLNYSSLMQIFIKKVSESGQYIYTKMYMFSDRAEFREDIDASSVVGFF